MLNFFQKILFRKMASIQKLLLNWNWNLCAEENNTLIFLCLTVTLTTQCFSVYEYFYQQERRLFKNKLTYAAVQGCIFMLSIVNMLVLGSTDSYLFNLSNALSFLFLIWANFCIYYAFAHLLAVEPKFQSLRKTGLIILGFLLLLNTVLVVILAVMPSDRIQRTEVSLLFFLYFFFAFYCSYFPFKQIRASKGNEEAALVSAGVYYLSIVIIYNIIAVVLVGMSKIDGPICETAVYMRLMSPVTAYFVYICQHPVPTFFRWAMLKSKEITDKKSVSRRKTETFSATRRNSQIRSSPLMNQ
eukprot:NODE_224_length_13912_cov_0.116604.p4 type:complete len:300 gc:universal NODE_224_length_13912_cov_0.116604:11176-12075(+)